MGWALGDGREHDHDPAWDAIEAEELYDLLEHEVIPEFYNRNEQGIPTAWVNRMRESMAQLTPRFSTNRATREYTEQHYLPASSAYRERAADQGKLGMEMIDWRQKLERNWQQLRFGELKTETSDGQHVFEVQVYLGDLSPEEVRLELYAEGVNHDAKEVHKMQHLRQDAAGGSVYCVRIPDSRPLTDYTARLLPYRTGVALPLEAPHILWQR